MSIMHDIIIQYLYWHNIGTNTNCAHGNFGLACVMV
jgi:hypothetical protein